MKLSTAILFINNLANHIMSKLSILPDLADISHFLSGGNQKAKNDELNKLRENALGHMLLLDDEYFSDPTYGSHWKKISEKFRKAVSSLCPEPYDNVKIERKGGMTFNHDYEFTYFYCGSKVADRKVEFKHNNTNVADLVQFLELYDKDCKSKYKLCDASYSEYYYENYLDGYIACDDQITAPKPDLATYLKHVHDIKYKHPFFKNLHDNKNRNKAAKKAVADESRREYLDLYVKVFNFEELTKKIRESQKDKVFLLWDCENFHTQVLDIDAIKITRVKNINDLFFDVEVENFAYDIRIRLNWGNSVGLANPRWKFSFTNKSEAPSQVQS